VKFEFTRLDLDRFEFTRLDSCAQAAGVSTLLAIMEVKPLMIRIAHAEMTSSRKNRKPLAKLSAKVSN
jgi:hypothetical protein